MAMKSGAVIFVLDKNGENVVEEIPIFFNPSEYTIESENNISEKEILGMTNKKEFTGGGEGTLTVELFFDSYFYMELEKSTEYKDVREYTKKIKNLQKIVSEYHQPPICALSWGSLYFKAFVKSVTEKFIMFSPEGIPVRAVLKVIFSEVIEIAEELRRNSLESADRTKARILKDGETLWSLANTEYDDASHWRYIASANNIDNPRKVKSGITLVVPSLE